jgi:transposase
MSMRRVEMHRLQELVRLHRMGTGAREVARMLHMSPNTERDYRNALEAEGLLTGTVDEIAALEVLRAAVERQLPLVAPPQMVSTLEPAVRDKVTELAKKGLQPQAIYDRLRLDDPSSQASFWSVRGAWRKWRKERGVRAEDVAIPVDTDAGEIAQVDFGYVGKLYDAARGVLRKAWVFVMVLAFSRRAVMRIVFDQKIETWLQLHVEAFAEFGGVVATVVPDNLKAAVIRAAFGVDGAASLNRSYRELARHYNFKIDPAPIYEPKKKGKVESAVKYVKRNFFVGRDTNDADDTKRELARWVDEIANTRIHGTTHRRPIDLFAEEREALTPLPDRRFETVIWYEARVHQDTHLAFDHRLYSAPWTFIGQQLWLRATASTVEIYDTVDKIVATHARRGRKVRSTIEAHLPKDRAAWRHRSRPYWEERADNIAPEVGAYARAVFDVDDTLNMLRTVQAIVTHLEKFPVERAVATCLRAHHFGSYEYGVIKNILRQGLDLQPVVSTPTSGPLLAPRFARPIGELLHHNDEDSDEHD